MLVSVIPNYVFRFLEFMKKNVLLILCVSFGLLAKAQTDYLVTLKSDTLKGEFRILSYDNMDRVQQVTKGKKEVFTALQISQLKLNEEIYKPVQYDKSIRLMKVLKSGFLTLYAFRMPNQSSYEGRYLVKQDGSSMEVPNIGFKKILASYLDGCMEVSERVKSGEYSRGDIEEVIELYNLCLNKNKPVRIETLQTTTQEKPTASSDVEILIQHVKQNEFATQKDVVDMLTDIKSKVDRNETVANYLLEGVRSLLKDQSALLEEFEKVATSLKK